DEPRSGEPRDQPAHPADGPAFQRAFAGAACLLIGALDLSNPDALVQVSSIVGGQSDRGGLGPRLCAVQPGPAQQEALVAAALGPFRCGRGEAASDPQVLAGLVDPASEAGPCAQECLVRD